MSSLKLVRWYETINLRKSTPNSKSLIMPHQDEAVRALDRYFDLKQNKGVQNGLVVMPTGSGKTYTAVHWLLKSGVANDFRILWLAHRQELIEQTYNEFVDHAPILADSGKCSLRVLPISGMHAPMSVASGYDIYICSIASAANKHGARFIRRMLGEPGKRKLIVVIDEAHHATSAQYQKVLDRITELNPNRILLGLTATPKRMQERDWRKLLRMFNVESNIKEGLGTKSGYIYEISLKQLILSGFLAKPIHEPVKTQLVGEIEYEFTEEDERYFNHFGELTEMVQNQIAKSSARNKVIIDQYMNNRERYGKTLIFAVNQNHAESLNNELNERGVKSDYVISRKPETQETIKFFKDKNNNREVLVNVQILTEGSDIPDVQTVFLTRETNSDTLLMQMIGRALRGVNAGGTEVAYIVDFHDTWNQFKFWLDPGELEIFKKVEPERIPVDHIPKTPNIIDIVGKPEISEIPVIIGPEPPITLRDLYFMLYEKMKAVWTSETENAIIPFGWYALVDSAGEELKMLVYEDQLHGFQKLGDDLHHVIERHPSAKDCIAKYFSQCDKAPCEVEMEVLLDHIFEMKKMPAFYTLEERKYIDPVFLVDRMKTLGLTKEDHKVMWLKELFDNSLIVSQIYKNFFAFKTSVFHTEKVHVSTSLVSEDERKQYNLVVGYHNLLALYHEVLSEFPDLSGEPVLSINWSEKVYKSWFGLCVANEDEKQFFILINKVLSSPQIDREVIKYLIFHELLHANGYWNHDTLFRDKEWSYPNSDELDGQLDELCIRYKLDLGREGRDRGGRSIPDIFEEIFKTKKDESETATEKPSETQAEIPTEKTTETPTETPTETTIERTIDKTAAGIIPGIKYCRNCGNESPETANFCNKCGKEMAY